MRRKRRFGIALALVAIVAVAASAAVVKARDSSADADRLALQKRFAELAGVKGAVPWGTNGLSISGEAEVNGNGPAQEEYENRAYPAAAIAHAQTLRGIRAAKEAARRAGVKLPSRWREVGPETLQVGRLGTQHFGLPTQWSGRVSAMAVDTRRCNERSCRLYIGAAGGGVWRTGNALARRVNWKEISDGLDSTSIGTAPDRSRPTEAARRSTSARASRTAPARTRRGSASTSRRTAATAGRSSRAACPPPRTAESAGSRSTRPTRTGS